MSDEAGGTAIPRPIGPNSFRTIAPRVASPECDIASIFDDAKPAVTPTPPSSRLFTPSPAVPLTYRTSHVFAHPFKQRSMKFMGKVPQQNISQQHHASKKSNVPHIPQSDVSIQTETEPFENPLKSSHCTRITQKIAAVTTLLGLHLPSEDLLHAIDEFAQHTSTLSDTMIPCTLFKNGIDCVDRGYHLVLDHIRKRAEKERRKFHHDIERLSQHSKRELAALHDEYCTRLSGAQEQNVTLKLDLEVGVGCIAEQKGALAEAVASHKQACIEWEADRRLFLQTQRSLKAEVETLLRDVHTASMKGIDLERQVALLNRQIAETIADYEYHRELCRSQEQLAKQTEIAHREKVQKLMQELAKAKTTLQKQPIPGAPIDPIDPPPSVAAESVFTRGGVGEESETVSELRSLLYNAEQLISLMNQRGDAKMLLASSGDLVVPAGITYRPLGMHISVPPPLRSNSCVASIALSRKKVHLVLRDLFASIVSEELPDLEKSARSAISAKSAENETDGGMAGVPAKPFTYYVHKYTKQAFGKAQIDALYSLMDAAEGMRGDGCVEMFSLLLGRRLGHWAVIQVEIDLDRVREAMQPHLVVRSRSSPYVLPGAKWVELVDSIFASWSVSQRSELKYYGFAQSGALDSVVLHTDTQDLPVLANFAVTEEGESQFVSCLRKLTAQRILGFRTTFEHLLIKQSTETTGKEMTTRELFHEAIVSAASTAGLYEASNGRQANSLQMYTGKVLELVQQSHVDIHGCWQYTGVMLEELAIGTPCPVVAEAEEEGVEGVKHRFEAKRTQYTELFGLLDRRLEEWVRPQQTRPAEVFAVPGEWGAAAGSDKKERRKQNLKKKLKTVLRSNTTSLAAVARTALKQGEPMFPLSQVILCARCVPIVGLSDTQAW